jgi:hypothetical protein
MSPGHRDGRRKHRPTPKRASMSTIGEGYSIAGPRIVLCCHRRSIFSTDSSSMLGAMYRRVFPVSSGHIPRRDTVHHLLGGDVSSAPVGSSGGWPVGWPSGQPSGVVSLLPIPGSAPSRGKAAPSAGAVSPCFHPGGLAGSPGRRRAGWGCKSELRLTSRTFQRPQWIVPDEQPGRLQEKVPGGRQSVRGSGGFGRS